MSKTLNNTVALQKNVPGTSLGWNKNLPVWSLHILLVSGGECERCV